MGRFLNWMEICSAAGFFIIFLYQAFFSALSGWEREQANRKEGKNKRRTAVTKKALMNVCNHLNQWIRKTILQHSVHKTQKSTQWEQSSTERRAAVESRASGTAAPSRWWCWREEATASPRPSWCSLEFPHSLVLWSETEGEVHHWIRGATDTDIQVGPKQQVSCLYGIILITLNFIDKFPTMKVAQWKWPRLLAATLSLLHTIHPHFLRLTRTVTRNSDIVYG